MCSNVNYSCEEERSRLFPTLLLTSTIRLSFVGPQRISSLLKPGADWARRMIPVGRELLFVVPNEMFSPQNAYSTAQYGTTQM